MTELLYQTDCYLQSCEANVIYVDEQNHGLILDRTVFYPGGGGQPHDKGFIEIEGKMLTVERFLRGEFGIVHVLQEVDTLPAVGIKVNCQLDWGYRYQLMRTHTAMHILCGVIFRDYGATVTGGDMEPLKGRMDFEFESLHKDLVHIIEEAINLEVANARPVRTYILPRDKAFEIPDLIRTKINLLPPNIQQVRVVEIEGLDIQADGGTHVRNTLEVGKIHIVDYKSKGKINKRIYVELEP